MTDSPVALFSNTVLDKARKRLVRKILARFGGPKATSVILGISSSTVNNWPEIGIPGLWHLRLLDAADARNIPLTRAELLSTMRRKKPVITLSPDIIEQPKV